MTETLSSGPQREQKEEGDGIEGISHTHAAAVFQWGRLVDREVDN